MRDSLSMVANQSQQADQTSEQRYRRLFNKLPICIFEINLAASPAAILEVNRRAEVIYGYPAADLIGKPASNLVSEVDWESLQHIVLRVQRGETVTVETTHRHRDGTTFPVRVIAVEDPIDSGRMLIAVEDISAEKQRRTEEDAIAADRRRIAHEIHDGVAQSLAGLRFKSALWSYLAVSAPPEMHTSLTELQSVLDTCIDDIRRAIFALRPVDLESMGFIPALTKYISDFGELNQVISQLALEGQPDRLSALYELPLFRIIQEGLNNVSHHAIASSVLVNLTVDARGAVVLSLRDNGRGFNLNLVGSADHSERYGLRQIRERIVELGGTLDIRSAIGQGVELIITLPPIPPESSNH